MSVHPGIYLIINKQSNSHIGRQNIHDTSPNPQNIVGQSPLGPPPVWEILPGQDGKYTIRSNGAPAVFLDNSIKVALIPVGQNIFWDIRAAGEDIYTISNDAGFWTLDLNGKPLQETLVTLSADKSDKAQWRLQPLPRE